MKGEVEIRAWWQGGDGWEINRMAEGEGGMIFAVRKQNYSAMGNRKKRRDKQGEGMSNHDIWDFSYHKLYILHKSAGLRILYSEDQILNR